MRRTGHGTVRKGGVAALVAVLACLALTSAGLATAASPTVVRAGNLVLKLNGGVAPERLPKKRSAPITLRISGDIATVDGSQPPAARRVVTEFDKHGGINARGLPSCRRGRLEARTTRAAKAACRRAIVGSGGTTVRVAFPESTSFYSSGPLVLFNGGVRGRVTTLYIHAYVKVPAPTAIVTPVKIRRVHRGRFGTRSAATIPVIAGGNGSVTHFRLKISRTFRHKKRRRSYLFARCANRRFFARGKVVFTGGPRIAGSVVRRCKIRR